MVLEVAASLADVRDDVDIVSPELVAVPDAGEHKQLGGVEGAGAEDDLLLAFHGAASGGVGDEDADRRVMRDHDLLDQGSRCEVEVGPLERGAQVRAGGIPAQAVVDERLGDMQALLAVGVVVRREAEACLLTGPQEGVIEIVLGSAPADPKWAVTA